MVNPDNSCSVLYHDNGQISEVNIYKLVGDNNPLLIKTSFYNRNGVLTRQTDWEWDYDSSDRNLYKVTTRQYGQVTGGLISLLVELRHKDFLLGGKTLKEKSYYPIERSSETQYQYYESTKKKFIRTKEIKHLVYPNGKNESMIKWKRNFDEEGNELEIN